ncbi:MAG: hypothetical protein ACQGQO_01145 [Sphaerochaetaceae bacterium]
MGNRMGKVPCSEGWIQQKNLEEKWRLFIRENPDTDWVNIKLAYDGERPHKANFQLSWSIAEKRFCAGYETGILMAKSPKLYKALLTYMEEMYD